MSSIWDTLDGLEAIPSHLVLQRNPAPASVKVGGSRQVIDNGPPPQGIYRPVRPGESRHALEYYDKLYGDSHLRALRSLGLSTEQARADISYQREAAIVVTIQHAGFVSEHDKRMRCEYTLSDVEGALFRVFFTDVGCAQPAPHFSAEESRKITDGLWTGSYPQAYTLAAFLFWECLHHEPYGPMSDRLGWYFACWALMASDIGCLPDHSGEWPLVRTLGMKQPFGEFRDPFTSCLRLQGGQGYRTPYFAWLINQS